MVLRKKLEDDPYSLTSEELYALENNDRLNEKIALLVKDALVKRAITNNERFSLIDHRQQSHVTTVSLRSF